MNSIPKRPALRRVHVQLAGAALALMLLALGAQIVLLTAQFRHIRSQDQITRTLFARLGPLVGALPATARSLQPAASELGPVLRALAASRLPQTADAARRALAQLPATTAVVQHISGTQDRALALLIASLTTQQRSLAVQQQSLAAQHQSLTLQGATLTLTRRNLAVAEHSLSLLRRTLRIAQRTLDHAASLDRKVP